MSSYVWPSSGSGGVTTIDGISGAVTLVAGAGITITDNSPVAGDITISASSAGLYTAGSVLFAGVTGAISQDNSKFFWDDTNFDLGIGTASPGASLEIDNGSTTRPGIINKNVANQTADNYSARSSIGTAYVTIGPDTLPGTSATSNFLNVTGTLPSATSAATAGVSLNITGAGSAAFQNKALAVTYSAGYTGSNTCLAVDISNLNAGTGVAAWTGGFANYGGRFGMIATTTGHNLGFRSTAGNSSSLNLGFLGAAISATNSPALNVGAGALALNATANVGGFFGLMNTAPILSTSAALIADNGATGSHIFRARANGTATTVIDDTGQVGVLTTAPSVPLDVNGNARIRGLTTAGPMSTDASGNLSSAAVLLRANGGTGLSAAGSSGNILTSNGTDWVSSAPATSGTVTAVSVASANGFAGSSSGGATPALTISTSITGVLKGNGTAISAATAGTDYSAGTSALATGILKSTTTTGALTIAVAGDFPTLNQNTTGTAAGLSATLVETSGGTNQSSYTTGDTLYASATNTLSKLAKGTSGQIYTQGASIPSWSNPPIPQFVLGATDSSRRTTANTSFTATAGPTVSITPTYTGTYRVSGIVNLANTTAGKGSYAAIEATVGSPTILLQNVIEYDCPTNGFSTSVPVMSYYTLTAATSYTFAVFIKTDSGGSASINNDNCPAVLTVQQVG